MHTMFRRYKPFFRTGAMNLLAYKFQMIMWLVISALQVACIFFLWDGVYKSSTTEVINGYTFEQMIVYMAFVNVASFVVLGGDTMWTIVREIKNGTIAMSFVKPISYRVRFIFSTLGDTTMLICLFGIPCFTILYVVFALIGFITVPVWWMLLLQILLFAVSALLAMLLWDCVNYICGILCFYTTAGWGLSNLKDTVIRFLSGSLIPLAFFPTWAEKLLLYSPFAGLSQNPVLILLGRYSLTQSLQFIGLSFAWWIVLEGLAWLLFNKASKKVTVQGG